MFCFLGLVHLWETHTSPFSPCWLDAQAFPRDVFARIQRLMGLGFSCWKIDTIPTTPLFILLHRGGKWNNAQLFPVQYCCCCFSASCKWGRKILGSCHSHWHKAQKSRASSFWPNPHLQLSLIFWVRKLSKTYSFTQKNKLNACWKFNFL